MFFSAVTRIIWSASVVTADNPLIVPLNAAFGTMIEPSATLLIPVTSSFATWKVTPFLSSLMLNLVSLTVTSALLSAVSGAVLMSIVPLVVVIVAVGSTLSTLSMPPERLTV